MHHWAVVGDVENLRNSPDPHRKSHSSGELHDLGVGELIAHPVEEGLIHVAMLEGKSLSELDRQALAWREIVTFLIVAHIDVLVFSQRLLRARRSPSVQSNVAVINLGEPHACRFDHIELQRSLFVHGIAEACDCLAH